MDKLEDKLKIPVQKKKTFKLFGFIAFSVITTEVVEFDHAEYYEKMREQISNEILHQVKLMVGSP